MSRPGEARLAKVKRSASVPKAGMPLGNSLRVRFRLRRLFGIHQAAVRFSHQGFDVDAVDQVDRIEHIALRFRHLVAFGIANQAGHENFRKGIRPVRCLVIITIRATQKKMMSKPVTSTEEGR